MARTSPSRHVPKLRRQRTKAGDRAFVELSGRRIYCGRWDSDESRQRYAKALAEWETAGRHAPVPADDLTVVELLARFWRHANAYYVGPDGKPTSSIHGYQMALRPVRKLYADRPAAEFGPKALRTCRQAMIEKGWSRGVVNQSTNLIRAVFKWAVAEELVPADVHVALQAVAPLRRGRTDAPDTEPRRPVPQAHIDAIHPHVSRQVWALIQLQLLTAARGGELVIMRAIDIDTTGRIWSYSPATHKKSYAGIERTIYIGPKAQNVLRSFMADRPVDAYLFSPAEAEAERYAACTSHRHQPVEPAKTDRKIGDHYTTKSYYRAIRYGCAKAKVPQWSPHRLRHSAGTFIRKEFGLEAARIILGHRSAAVT